MALGGNLAGTSGSSDTSYAAGIGVSWEVDIWGKIRAGASAADESLRATVADFQFARQSLAANAAKGWFLRTELKMQRDLAQETVDILSQMVDLVKTKQDIGQLSMQDVSLVEAGLGSRQQLQGLRAWQDSV